MRTKWQFMAMEKQDQKAKRLQQALRQNLQNRKMQKKARENTDDATALVYREKPLTKQDTETDEK